MQVIPLKCCFVIICYIPPLVGMMASLWSQGLMMSLWPQGLMMWWPYDVMVLWWCGLRVLCCGGSYDVVVL